MKNRSGRNFTFYNRGLAHLRKGDFERAISDNSKVIEVTPDDAEAYNNRAIAYGEKNDLNQAIVDYTKAIEINPNYAVAYFNRGTAYAKHGLYEEALADFNKAIGINPNLGEAYVSRGIIYSQKDRVDEAISDFDKAVSINPNLAEAYFNRASTYLQKGNFKQAISDLNNAIRLNPGNPDAYLIRAEAFLGTHEYDRSREDVNKAKMLHGAIDSDFLERLKKESGRTMISENNHAWKRRKIFFQWVWYWLTILFFISALGFFILEVVVGIPKNFASVFCSLMFVAYLFSEKILERKIAAHEKAFCYFATYWFMGLVLTGLLRWKGLEVVWLPITYFMMVFGIILVQTAHFVKHVEKGSRRVYVLLSSAGWGGHVYSWRLSF